MSIINAVGVKGKLVLIETPTRKQGNLYYDAL